MTQNTFFYKTPTLAAFGRLVIIQKKYRTVCLNATVIPADTLININFKVNSGKKQ